MGTNTPNKVDGDILDAANLFKHVGEDVTQGSVGSSTTETELGEVTVSANQGSSKLLIIISVRVQNDLAANNGGTFRIRTGTSATATSNTLRKSYTINVFPSGGTTIGGMVMTTIDSVDEDFTQDFFVHVTGQNTFSSVSVVSFVEDVQVIGV